jgi:hypothetical protein
MEIPDSIRAITTETENDSFRRFDVSVPVSYDDIIGILKQKINYQDYKSFEEGLVTYKQNVTSDKNFIKNIILLYSNAIASALKETQLPDSSKTEIIKTYTSILLNVSNNIESLHSLICSLNDNKNIIDVRKISYIILGYAIDTVRKIHDNEK